MGAASYRERARDGVASTTRIRSQRERSKTMPQITVPASFYRGGTSRAVLFREADLAQYDDAAQRAIILAALGSPDPYGREIDGLGGGISSLSKVCIVGVAGPESGADVTFRFGQVDVESPMVEFLGTCGNMSAAIGPFSVDEGLVEAVEPITTVRVQSTNTGQIYLCHVPVRDGRAEVEGDYSIDGVPGPAARIALEFLEPGGCSAKACCRPARCARRSPSPTAAPSTSRWWTLPTRSSSSGPPTWARTPPRVRRTWTTTGRWSTRSKRSAITPPSCSVWRRTSNTPGRKQRPSRRS